MSCTMPSKGVHTYTYISVPPAHGNVEIELSVPKRKIKRKDHKRFENENLEVDLRHLGWFKFTGKFHLRVHCDGKLLTEQFLEIEPVSGHIRSGSSMDDTMNETKSIVKDGLVISYGSYEAGAGIADLPKRHQVYVSVTADRSGWMGDVAPQGSKEAAKPFHRLVLPAPHDVGMNSMETITSILKHAGKAAASMLVTIAPQLKAAEGEIATVIGGLSDGTVAQIAPAIIASLSITQKDTLATLLRTGARYFEFRPAHCHEAILPYSPLPDKLYFQHGPIPGMSYDTFLTDLVLFLATNPTEIAVVHIRWDGVPPECKRPDEKELDLYLRAAMWLGGGDLKAGSLEDLKDRTIKELRESGKRLLYVVEADVLSTYGDVSNATTDGRSILRAFETMLTSEMQSDKSAGRGKAFTVAQCQATPTNLQGVIKYSVLTASSSTMALMSTKALCDHLLLPWVRMEMGVKKGDKNGGRMRTDRLIVLMNDFLEGATVDVAVDLSRERLMLE